MSSPFFPPVSGPAPSTPTRRAGSVRRTASIDAIWPDGIRGPMMQEGRARDLLTLGADHRPEVLAQDRFVARLTPAREIIAIEAEPARAALNGLVGARAGSQLRSVLAETLPDERDRGSPLYLLLDDIAGSSLVAGWAWSRWDPDWLKTFKEAGENIERRRPAEGVCIGFSPGFSALAGEDARPNHNSRPVALLDQGDDPDAWHDFPRFDGPTMRRARRIDVWQEDAIRVEAHFQDSALLPSGGREGLHEYLLTAVIDPATMTVTEIAADPRILPFRECPSAILNIGRLVGTPVAALRQTVIEKFARTEGCTHLNDMMRSLAEVPQMVASLPARAGKVL